MNRRMVGNKTMEGWVQCFWTANLEEHRQFLAEFERAVREDDREDRTCPLKCPDCGDDFEGSFGRLNSKGYHETTVRAMVERYATISAEDAAPDFLDPVCCEKCGQVVKP